MTRDAGGFYETHATLALLIGVHSKGEVSSRGDTLQPTALVHEVYVRLVDQRQCSWESRAEFFGVASQVIPLFYQSRHL